jgi:cyclic pyranopterin monophosphate synthase
MSNDSFTHLDEEGRAHMVDVGEKPITTRRARAQAVVHMSPDTARAIRDVALSKGDALSVARIAGIMGAKRTADLIPLCHSLALDHVSVDLVVKEDSVVIHTEAVCRGKTGIEMEALTAAMTAALTLYDMAKARDKSMVIGEVMLLEKSGGRSGTWLRDELG